MRLSDYLDKGASLGSSSPCLTMGDRTLSYREVQRLARSIARALRRSGVQAGGKVAILSANDPIAFTCVFGIALAGAVWCPINPRNEAAENRDLLDAFDCTCLIYQQAFAPLVDQILPALPKLRTVVCLDGSRPGSPSLREWIDDGADDATDGTARQSAAASEGSGSPVAEAFSGSEPTSVGSSSPVGSIAESTGDLAMIVGTGGTTGRPKGVMLTGRNLETMTALTLMGYPFHGRPVYLALAPLTHAAGVLCFPVLAMGGEIVIMPKPDLGAFLALVASHRVTHTFLPPTLIYMLLDHPDLRADESVVAAMLLVRCGTDVGRSAGRGDHQVRPGHGAALRPDRGADDDLHDAAGGSSEPRRQHRRAPARIRGAAGAAGHGGGDGRIRRSAAGRRAGRNRHPQFPGDGRVLQESRSDAGRFPDSAGTTPATSAIWTRTISCTSSTGSRT